MKKIKKEELRIKKGNRAVLAAVLSLFLFLCSSAVANDKVKIMTDRCGITDSTKTTSGTIAGDALKVEFVFSSDFAGTINGVTWSGANDASKTYSPPTGKILPAITYTITAGNARVTEYR